MIGVDKNEVIFNQYDLKINRIYRVKGATILDTSQGQKIMREYQYSEGKAMLVNCIMQHLRQGGFENVDYILENNDGHLISENQYGNKYVIKDYFPGEECDLKNEQDVLCAVENLAKIHTLLNGVDFSFINEKIRQDELKRLEEGNDDKQDEIVDKIIVPKKDVRELLYNHSKEIKRVNKYIGDKKKKNEFEVEFLNCFSVFREQPIRAVEQINSLGYDKLLEDAFNNSKIIHGDFTHHNIVFFNDEECAITGYEKSVVGIQIYDLYKIIRKVMEKNTWDYLLGSKIVNKYISVRENEGSAVNSEELNVLYSLLIFPEKLWKIADYYYNRRKSWISVRMIEKLNKLKMLEDGRQSFIENFFKDYIVL